MCYTVIKHLQDIREHSRNVKNTDLKRVFATDVFSVIAPRALEGLVKCRQTVFHCAVDCFKSRLNGFFQESVFRFGFFNYGFYVKGL